ncbi:MAG: hypothetical protein ABIS30_00720 [Gallionella sp.]
MVAAHTCQLDEQCLSFCLVLLRAALCCFIQLNRARFNRFQKPLLPFLGLLYLTADLVDAVLLNILG